MTAPPVRLGPRRRVSQRRVPIPIKARNGPRAQRKTPLAPRISDQSASERAKANRRGLRTGGNPAIRRPAPPILSRLGTSRGGRSDRAAGGKTRRRGERGRKFYGTAPFRHRSVYSEGEFMGHWPSFPTGTEPMTLRRPAIRGFLLAALSLAALAGTGSAPASAEAIKLALASPGPLADPVNEAVREAGEQGLDVEVVEFTDWITPNEALNNGDIDVNYYQHCPSSRTPRPPRATSSSRSASGPRRSSAFTPPGTRPSPTSRTAPRSPSPTIP